MTIIRIEQNDNFAHDNQTINGVTLEDFPLPEGYAIVPEEVGTPETLENYPFGEVTVEDVNGVPTVTSWTPLPIPEPEPEPLEQVKETKLAALSAACSAAITAGCDVELSAGVGHIALTAEDQINLSAAMQAVEQGAAGYPYHLDGQLCAIFPAADIVAMAQAATAHKLYHTTYYNHLAAWVRRCESVEEVQAITYGVDLPEDLAANMAAVLAAAGGDADA